MIATSNPTTPSGRVHVEELAPIVLTNTDSNSTSVECAQYCWRPSPELGLPPDFQLSLECKKGNDQIRRFVPMVGVSSFLLKASLVGHMLLAREGLDSQQSFSYHAMRLIYQHSSRQREAFYRRFKRVADLRIIPRAQAGGVINVLPDSIGLDSLGNGECWTIGELMRRGSESLGADERGDQEAVIAAGLLESARRDPIDIRQMTPDEISRLIRISLFDTGPTEVGSIDEDTHARVIARLLNAIEKHADDSTEEFHVWFFEKRDNLIRQIAKQKKNGGPIERDAVRQVLLETVYSAHQYVAQCVDIAMREFANCLPTALSSDESALFRRLYLCNPELGGFPLLMLQSQFTNHRSIVVEIMSNPGDTEPLAVLLRCLSYNADMTVKRREADCRYKAMGAITKAAEPRRSPTNAEPKPINFSVIAERLQLIRGITCNCVENDLLTQVSERHSDGSFTFSCKCSSCDWQEEIKAGIEELKDLASDH